MIQNAPQCAIESPQCAYNELKPGRCFKAQHVAAFEGEEGREFAGGVPFTAPLPPELKTKASCSDCGRCAHGFAEDLMTECNLSHIPKKKRKPSAKEAEAPRAQQPLEAEYLAGLGEEDYFRDLFDAELKAMQEDLQ